MMIYKIKSCVECAHKTWCHLYYDVISNTGERYKGNHASDDSYYFILKEISDQEAEDCDKYIYDISQDIFKWIYFQNFHLYNLNKTLLSTSSNDDCSKYKEDILFSIHRWIVIVVQKKNF